MPVIGQMARQARNSKVAIRRMVASESIAASDSRLPSGFWRDSWLLHILAVPLIWTQTGPMHGPASQFVVAGACNVPNALVVPFRIELVRSTA